MTQSRNRSNGFSGSMKVKVRFTVSLVESIRRFRRRRCSMDSKPESFCPGGRGLAIDAEPCGLLLGGLKGPEKREDAAEALLNHVFLGRCFSGPSLFERFGLGWLWSVTLLRPNQPAPPPVRCRLTEGLGS